MFQVVQPYILEGSVPCHGILLLDLSKMFDKPLKFANGSDACFRQYLGDSTARPSKIVQLQVVRCHKDSDVSFVRRWGCYALGVLET